MELLTWVLVFIGYCSNKPPPPGVTNNVLGKALVNPYRQIKVQKE